MKVEGIKMPYDHSIKNLDEEVHYKYQFDNIKHPEVTKKISSKYIRRVEKLLKFKLSGRNILKAINMYAIIVISYRAGIVD